MIWERKIYKIRDDQSVVFDYDEHGIGKITVEYMDTLMDLVAKSEGEWKKIGEYADSTGATVHVLNCQKCGAQHRTRRLHTGEYVNANYCPNCGVRMTGIPLPRVKAEEGEEVSNV